MSIEFEAALRRRKPERHRTQLKTRELSELTDAAALATSGVVGLVADTNVYINDAAGRLPTPVQALLDRALLFHCSVCIGELAIGVANNDPTHPHWTATRDHYAALVASMPSTRVLTPDAQVWAEAGLVAGTLARTQGFSPQQRKACLNDALIFLTAAKTGLPVLTANRDEFDRIQQLCPEGRFVHY